MPVWTKKVMDEVELQPIFFFIPKTLVGNLTCGPPSMDSLFVCFTCCSHAHAVILLIQFFSFSLIHFSCTICFIPSLMYKTLFFYFPLFNKFPFLSNFPIGYATVFSFTSNEM